MKPNARVATHAARADSRENTRENTRERVDTIWAGVVTGESLPEATIDPERASFGGATLDIEASDEFDSYSGATIGSDGGDDDGGGERSDEREQSRTITGSEEYIGGRMPDSTSPLAEGSGAPRSGRSREEFRIDGKLASGGMGDVYLATQTGLGRTVALKRPREHLRKDHRKLDAFEREATVTGDLEHPSIVPIYQNGVDADGLPFYAMKLVRGTEWKYLLHPQRAQESRGDEASESAVAKAASMRQRDHIEILLKVCDAMAFAHNKHVVHRDLKPANVMVGDFGEVQVMDWGLAVDVRDAHESGKAIPRSYVRGPGGTPSYMAPEMALAERERIDHRTDIYLLGAILYEILTGQAPHRGDNAMQTLYHAASNDVVHPRELEPSAPRGLSEIAMRALATDPRERQQDVAEFQSELREYLRHAQSLRITERAEADLLLVGDDAETGSGAEYVEFAGVVAAFRQALDLWPGNTPARDGLQRGLVAFVKTALEGGDLGLARAQADELAAIVGENDERLVQLRAEWVRLDRKRRKRRWQLASAVATAALLLAALAAGAAFSFQRIREERDVADEQRGLAQRSLGIAKDERARAETERTKAVKSALLAEERRRDADEQRKMAQANLELAEQQRTESEQRRLEALTNLAKVDIQRAEAAVESNRDYPVAAAHILRAIRTMADADTTAPRHLLARYLDASPQLLERVVLPSPAKAVRSDPEEADGFCALLDDGGMWFPNRRETGEGPTIHAKAFIRWHGEWVRLTRAGVIYLGAERLSVPGLPREGVSCIASAAEGELLLAGSTDGQVFVVEGGAEDGAVRHAIAHRGATTAVCAVPGSMNALSAGTDGRLILWDVSDMRRTREVRAHAGFVGALASSAGGESAATAGADGVIRVWHMPDLTERMSLAAHTGEVGALAFHPSRPWLASQSWDDTVRLWNLASADDRAVATLHVDLASDAAGIAFSSAGNALAVLAGERELCVWDVGERNDVTPRVWSEVRLDGQQLIAEMNGTLLASSEGHLSVLRQTSATPDRLEGSIVHLLHPVGDNPKRWLAVHSSGILRWWHSGVPAAKTDARIVAAAGRNQTIALATDAGEVFAGRLDAKAVHLECRGLLRGAKGLAVSALGNSVVTYNGDGEAIVWGLGDPKRIRLEGLGDIIDMHFRADGKTVVVVSNVPDISVFDLESETIVDRLRGHTEALRASALGQSGRLMATGGADGQIRIWDLEGLTSYALVSGLDHWVGGLLLNEERGVVTCLLDDGAVRRFRLPRADLEATASALTLTVRETLGIDALPESDGAQR